MFADFLKEGTAVAHASLEKKTFYSDRKDQLGSGIRGIVAVTLSPPSPNI